MARPGRKPIQIDLDKVESLAAQQMTDVQICDCLGISDETLRRRKRDHVEFVETIARGKAKGLAIITNKHFEAAKNGNVDAQKHILKCKAGWVETSRQELVGEGGGPIKATLEMTDDELESIARGRSKRTTA